MRDLNSGCYEYSFSGLENFPPNNCTEEGRKSQCTSALWLGLCNSMLPPAKDMFLELVTSEGFMIFTCEARLTTTEESPKKISTKIKAAEQKKIEGEQI